MGGDLQKWIRNVTCIGSLLTLGPAHRFKFHILVQIHAGQDNNMHLHADQRFPGSAPAIEALASESKSFATLLADYEELSTWLAVWKRSAGADQEEISNALELVGELEQEIRQLLEEHDERRK